LEPHSDGLLSIPDQISLQPDVGYEFKAFASLVDQLWLTLSPDEQQLFSLLFERVSEVEIRQRLGGVSSGALRARIYRLRSKLRRECAKAGYARCSIPGSPG
jgi:DNA-directed RNA polymerase specialized sigma24 family protein